MFQLVPVCLDHELAILNFERVNRSYFTGSINDRGDDYFHEFAQHHRELLADQEAGNGAYFVLVDHDQSIVGRFNLYDIVDRTANVGYRVAQRVAGHGVASAALKDLCRMAGEEYGLVTLRAVTSKVNVASQRVLIKAGFVAVGPAEVVGQPGIQYEVELASL
jgi:[ribosomal protein S5]-alanine N-acetyltransferase